MAKAAPEITGFHLGGVVPLDRVGFMMRDFVLNGGSCDTIQPFAETRKADTSGHKSLSDTSGVAGLLPPPDRPAKPPNKLTLKRQARILAVLQKHQPSEVSTGTFNAALAKKGMSDYLVRKHLAELIQTGAVKGSRFGHYVLGEAQSEQQFATVSEAATIPTSDKKGKEPTILAFIAAGGDNGASRKEIMAHLKTAGFTGKHWDHGPILRLLKRNEITPVKGVKGRWKSKPTKK